MTSPAREILAGHLAALKLTGDAQAYLIALWDLFQGLDDWVDGTDCPREEKDRVIWLACVGLSVSPFAAQHGAWLAPVVANAVLKWQASDAVERAGEREHLPKAYMWRASYYDIVLQVVLLVHGQDAAARIAPVVMKMYGESYEDYAKEFSGA